MLNDAYLLNVGLLNSMNAAGIALTVSQLHLFSRGVGIMSRTLFLFDWSSFTIFGYKICLVVNTIFYNLIFCYTGIVWIDIVFVFQSNYRRKQEISTSSEKIYFDFNLKKSKRLKKDKAL